MNETKGDAGSTPAGESMQVAKKVALRLDTELDAPVERVWRALSEPEILARWLLPVTPGAASGEFSLDGGEKLDGRIDCTILESKPPRRLSLLWRPPAEKGKPAAETVVDFTLTELPGDRTRLELVHDGFEVPADYAVDRIAEEEILVLLPMAALLRRLPRRRRPATHLRRGALPTVMRLAA